jgi:hypothetical protein
MLVVCLLALLALCDGRVLRASSEREGPTAVLAPVIGGRTGPMLPTLGASFAIADAERAARENQVSTPLTLTNHRWEGDPSRTLPPAQTAWSRMPPESATFLSDPGQTATIERQLGQPTSARHY